MKTAAPVADRTVVEIGLALSRRVTEPVGVPVVVLATYAVMFMEEPAMAVAPRLLSVIRVGAGLMVRVAAGDAMA